MSVVMEARNLARRYQVNRGLFGGSATVHALSDATFLLEAGKTLAIVGESGSGKSTLARLVTMMERPSAGSLSMDDLDVARATRSMKRLFRRDVQMVFQNPYGSLNPRQTVLEAVMEPLSVNDAQGTKKHREVAMEMLERVGIRPEQAGRYPHMFSGGQRQRIAIARALVLKPKVLVLDEPVSALDISIRAQVLNLLDDLKKELKLAYLFISHDLSVVRHIADRVMVIYLGRVVEEAATETLFSNPQHPYTQALLSATPTTEPESRKARIVLKGDLPSPFNLPKGCGFHPRCPVAMERCKQERPNLEAVGTAKVACFKPGPMNPGEDRLSSEPLSAPSVPPPA
jgi:dipeptide transport system ATP-binding protein